MMNLGYENMMGQGVGILGLLFEIILLIDAILFGVWLWQKIQKKK